MKWGKVIGFCIFGTRKKEFFIEDFSGKRIIL